MSKLVSDISKETGLPEHLVRRLMTTAPVRYKQFHIPKKTKGLREIAQPAREVKLLQRSFINRFLCKLPVHTAAAAYISGRSIRDNALAHAGRGPILKIDFKNFFPSIVPNDWEMYCLERSLFLNGEDIELSSSLLFHRPKGTKTSKLAIGAPSSPMLSNVLMFYFDDILTRSLAKDNVVYTRYADDLTFSAPRTGYLVNVLNIVRQVISDVPYPKLLINEEKTVYATSKYRRQVTGLILSNDGRITIGREKKRETFARVNAAKNGKLDVTELQKLAGYLSHINSVEPGFLNVLARKYGAEVITSIFHYKISMKLM